LSFQPIVMKDSPGPRARRDEPYCLPVDDGDALVLC
jgi:hypothetical protein